MQRVTMVSSFGRKVFTLREAAVMFRTGKYRLALAERTDSNAKRIRKMIEAGRIVEAEAYVTWTQA